MTYAPIVLFVYNRPDHTLKTLEALSKNRGAENSKLYIFSDGPKNEASKEDQKKIFEVRELIKSKKWCQSVVIYESESNQGLANSVILGISQILEDHDRVIVLEDDIVTSEGFLTFMNDALGYYSEAYQVAGVSGFTYPISKTKELPNFFFLPIISSWGWGTWRRVWENFNPRKNNLNKIIEMNEIEKFNHGDHNFFEMLERQVRGELDSWAIRFYAHVFLRNQWFLYPKHSFIYNIGLDNSGTHSTRNESFYNSAISSLAFEPAKIQLHESIVKKSQRLDRNESGIHRFLDYIKRFLYVS
jgi:hypothetical protein